MSDEEIRHYYAQYCDARRKEDFALAQQLKRHLVLLMYQMLRDWATIWLSRRTSGSDSRFVALTSEDELVNIAVEKLLRVLDRHNPDRGELRGWVYRVSHNRWRSYARYERMRTHTLGISDVDELDEDDGVRRVPFVQDGYPRPKMSGFDWAEHIVDLSLALENKRLSRAQRKWVELFLAVYRDTLENDGFY